MRTVADGPCTVRCARAHRSLPVHSVQACARAGGPDGCTVCPAGRPRELSTGRGRPTTAAPGGRRTLGRMGQRLHRAGQLRAAGYTAGEVHRMLRSGALTAVRRGAYVEGARPEDAALRHALLVRAAVAELDGSAVVSHVSAAAVHGLAVWGLPLDVVQVTRNRSRSGARRGTRVHVHSAPLSDDEIVVVDGVACTGLARTVVDWPGRCRSSRPWSAPTRRCTPASSVPPSTRPCAGPADGRAYPPPAEPLPSPTAAARAWASRAAASRSHSPGCPLPRCSGPSGTEGRRPTRTSVGPGNAPSGSSTARSSTGGC